MSIGVKVAVKSRKNPITETCLWTSAWDRENTGCRTKPVTALAPSKQALVLNQ